jgi:hypothetical protein
VPVANYGYESSYLSESMFKFLLRSLIPIVVLLSCFIIGARSHALAPINNTIQQHIFEYNQLTWLKDTAGKITFSQLKNITRNEYSFLGIFYGLILVFCLFNLIMFMVRWQVQYLYYIAYNLSIGIYEMCNDGIAYQYIWPNSPIWNQYAYGIALFAVSIFALLFTRSLLNLKVNVPWLNKAIGWVMVCRCFYFVDCLVINNNWFNYTIIEFIPLSLALYAGCYTLYKGYKPARFFVIGYAFLLAGFVIKSCIAFGIGWLPGTGVDYYSLSICFVIQLLFISFALSYKAWLSKKENDDAQQRMTMELNQNEELKDILNKRLEKRVPQRTRQLVKKANNQEASPI